MKQSVKINYFWYSDLLVIPKMVSIITTIDDNGIVNAAPYSLCMPYNVGNKNPQIIVLSRKSSHSFKNVLETKEFVLNFPSWEYLQDLMETASSWPRGENELMHTSFTEIPSRQVKPPSIEECYQHIECRLNKVIELETGQSHLVGDIVDIVIDEEFIALGRGERARTMDLPVYLGDEKRKDFYFGRIGEIEMIQLKRPRKNVKYEIKKDLLWEENAFKELNKIPTAVQEMVVEVVEEWVKARGEDKVTYTVFKALEEEFAPKDLRERFG